MPGYHQVETATQIGMLIGERDSAAACTEALRLLSGLLASDATMLAARDPFTGTHYKLAGIGVTEQAARSLAVDFVTTPWYQDVMTQPLPPTASGEGGRQYRRGWFYQEYVRPAGFRDGMSGALRNRGRYVGMVHLSAERAGAFSTEARHLLASVMPALASLADVTGRAAHVHDLPADAPAALITRNQIVDLPGRERPRVLEEGSFRQLVDEFQSSGGQRLRALWPSWYRVVLSRHECAGRQATRATLVRAQPTALPFGLTPRELDVLTRAAMGQTNQLIADELFLSPRTVHSHVEHLLRKTGTASRAEATALAMRDGLLRPVPGRLRHFIHS
jgi:DNA-binding CsgD family transcriptional regulator